ncbi:PAS domain S-box protein [Spirosoma sp. KCTC 42546]|uniref:sensor histidine kinase n=1 Tax=Spirosoma sp. KCTC 42546 TaxID=2520506 RepID=UPI0011582783|nr:PAS domain S-box protein [Spirosoma sp. KCTC 42546]QDK81141.1 PAS domain S-box protein [Spirosoma sp. KCTC 42546]
MTLSETEQHRLQALMSYTILDSLPEAEYDAITQIAAHICQTPISLITFLDTERQWFKAAQGLTLKETPRQYSFCAHALQTPTQLMEVMDARVDERFAQNPFTLSDPPVIFYAGVPLIDEAGQALGTLCVLDHQPRHLSDQQATTLQSLAQQVVSLLKLRRSQTLLSQANQLLNDTNALLQAVVSSCPAGLTLFEPVYSNGELTDFKYVFTNDANALIAGRSVEQMTGSTLNSLFSTAVTAGLFDRLKTVQQTGQPLQVQWQVTVEHGQIWCNLSMTPIRERVLLCVQDISQLKRTEQQLQAQTENLEQHIAERTLKIGQLSAWQNAILEHAGQSIVSTDIYGIVRTANRAIEQLLGYKPEELIGCVVQIEPGTPENPVPLVSYQPSSDLPTSELFKTALETDGFFHTECLILGKRGQRIPVFMTASTLKDEGGKVTGYVGMATDISALKAAEEKAEKTSRELKIFFERALDLHCITSLDGHFLKVNQAWTETLGYLAEEMEGHYFLEFIHPDDRDDSLQTYQRPVIDGFVNRYQHKDGSYRLIQWRAKRYEKLIYSSARDITERKKAEDALRESEQRFREIAENVDEVFWIQSAVPFQLLYINPAYERVFGMTSQSLYDDPYSFLNAVIPEDRPMVEAAFEQYRQGEEIPVQYRVQGGDGLIHWLNVRSFVMKDSGGIPLRCIGIASDITDMKEKELVLQQSLIREQELNKLKSQFVATASHEFRTPLATIQSSVDLIGMYLEQSIQGPPPAISRHLEIIEREIANFSELLTDILTFGKIDAGRIPFHPEPVDLVALTNRVIETHFADRKDNRVVDVLIEGEPERVSVDQKLISHVLVNLLSNAFKFSQSNPKLLIGFGAQLVISVIDQGIGIPAEEQAHLFQTFFRAKNVVNIHGSGLGLVIVREFVELHGGTIRIDSVEHEGTTVTFTLLKG